jgi:hypothetical protein
MALNIFTAPAGSTIVGQVPQYASVYLLDGSLLRDWVFIGKPGPDGISPRGWIKYEYLTACPHRGSPEPPPEPPEEPAS